MLSSISFMNDLIPQQRYQSVTFLLSMIQQLFPPPQHLEEHNECECCLLVFPFNIFGELTLCFALHCFLKIYGMFFKQRDIKY